MVKVREVTAKSILNKSKIFDYCVNAYTGCEVGCLYCYARLFIPRYTGHAEPWGTFVDAKTNAPGLLRKQLKRAKRGRVWLSSVCDAYQPLEAEFRLTRRCLEELLLVQFPVQVQSKSARMVRDLDLFRQFKDIEVGFTITTVDERIARFFEPRASSAAERLAALKKIHEAGVRTFAFLGPLLPGDPQKLAAGLEGGVDHVLIDRMNYLGSFRHHYLKFGLAWAAEEEFFRGQRERLADALSRRSIPFELLF